MFLHNKEKYNILQIIVNVFFIQIFSEFIKVIVTMMVLYGIKIKLVTFHIFRKQQGEIQLIEKKSRNMKKRK